MTDAIMGRLRDTLAEIRDEPAPRATSEAKAPSPADREATP
jgi:hypothetical protein